MKKKISALLALLLCVTVLYSQGNSENLKKIEDNLYVIQNLGGNVTFLTTSDGVFVVDAGTYPSSGKKIIETIKSVSDKPIRYIALTHYHYDHTYGLQSFPDEATIICTKNCATNMETNLTEELKKNLEEFPEKIEGMKGQLANIKTDDPSYGGIKGNLDWHISMLEESKNVVIQKPDTTIEENTTIYLGTDTIELIVPASGHTNGNMVVKFKNHNAIHLGDLLFNAMHPYVDWRTGSDVNKWIATLEGVHNEEYKTIIPGHGNVADNADLQKEIDYMKKMRSLVQAKIDKGISLEETLQTIKPSDFEGIGFEWMIPKTIEGFYKNLSEK